MKHLIAFAAAVVAVAAPKTPPAAPAETISVNTPSLARVVQYGMRDTVRLQTKPLYVATIVLPADEKIAHFLCGDKDFWSLSGMGNIAWVKPAQNQTTTNAQLITMSGNVYTFHLVSSTALEPDFKIFVELKDEEMLSALKAGPRFVEATAVAGLKEEAEQWRLESYRLRKETVEKVAAAKAEATTQAANAAPAQSKHEYRFASRIAPFNIAGIWHDGRFTYIQATPEELPALYEIRDGKPNLIKFEYANGMYTVDKVMEDGYLQIGKKKTSFNRIR